MATSKDDPWSSKTYSETVAPFVPRLTQRVVDLLDPHPSDIVLDLGCGDGVLTTKLARKTKTVVGIDSSPSMIEAAQEKFATDTNTAYFAWDATELRTFVTEYPTIRTIFPQIEVDQRLAFTKVFSNAALHWILASADAREDTLKAVFSVLDEGGKFVAEFGGHLNIAEIHSALYLALRKRGIPLADIKKVDPWFFPRKSEIEQLLQKAGFRIEMIEEEFRPTQLTKSEGGGIGGWIRLFGEQFLGLVEEGVREEIVQEVSEAIEAVGTAADGTVWVGYNRLRFVAVRDA